MEFATSSMGALQHLLHVKLTPSNYLVWKNQLDPLINCFKLVKFIKPSLKAIDAAIPKYVVWYRKDQLLKSWIPEEVLPQTIGLLTLSDVWSAFLTSSRAPTKARFL